MSWRIYIDGEEYEADDSQIEEHIASGTITPATQVRRPDDTEWSAAWAAFPQFFESGTATATPAGTGSQVATESANLGNQVTANSSSKKSGVGIGTIVSVTLLAIAALVAAVVFFVLKTEVWVVNGLSTPYEISINGGAKVELTPGIPVRFKVKPSGIHIVWTHGGEDRDLEFSAFSRSLINPDQMAIFEVESVTYQSAEKIREDRVMNDIRARADPYGLNSGQEEPGENVLNTFIGKSVYPLSGIDYVFSTPAAEREFQVSQGAKEVVLKQLRCINPERLLANKGNWCRETLLRMPVGAALELAEECDALSDADSRESAVALIVSFVAMRKTEECLKFLSGKTEESDIPLHLNFFECRGWSDSSRESWHGRPEGTVGKAFRFYSDLTAKHMDKQHLEFLCGWFSADRSAAAEHFEKASAAGSAWGDFGLGWLAYNLGDVAGAAERVNVACNKEPANPYFLELRGAVQFEVGEPDKALKDIIYALEKEPRDLGRTFSAFNHVTKITDPYVQINRLQRVNTWKDSSIDLWSSSPRKSTVPWQTMFPMEWYSLVEYQVASALKDEQRQKKFFDGFDSNGQRTAAVASAIEQGNWEAALKYAEDNSSRGPFYVLFMGQYILEDSSASDAIEKAFQDRFLAPSNPEAIQQIGRWIDPEQAAPDPLETLICQAPRFDDPLILACIAISHPEARSAFFERALRACPHDRFPANLIRKAMAVSEQKESIR